MPILPQCHSNATPAGLDYCQFRHGDATVRVDEMQQISMVLLSRGHFGGIMAAWGCCDIVMTSRR
jgi:hypothetical protein